MVNLLCGKRQAIKSIDADMEHSRFTLAFYGLVAL
jgi:hypothetical protein